MTVYWEGNTYDTQQEAADAAFVTQPAVRYRVRKGIQWERDLWTTGEFWWNGEKYKNLSTAARAAGQNPGKFHYWYHVLKWRCDADVKSKQVHWNGKPYKNMRRAALANDINPGTFRYHYHVNGYRCDCDYDAGAVVECQHKHGLSK